MTFRLDTQQFFLTYSQCNIEPTRALELITEAFASKKRTIEDYIIAQEDHQDGGKHLHCWIKLDKKLNLRSASLLDLGENHGNYQGVRSKDRVQRYCTKDGNFISKNPYTPKEKTTKTHWSTTIALAEKGQIQEAIENLKASGEAACRDFVIHHTAIMTTLARLAPPVALTGTRQLSDFGSLFHWDRTTTLILCGPTNRGKTTLAKSLMPHGLFVSHMDQLRNFNGHEGVIFDDMSFKHLPRESQICLVDTHEERAIHIRYGIATLKANTPRIITTNRSPDDILNIHDGAIARRTLCITWWGHDKDPNWELYDTNLHSSHIFNLPFDQ